MSTMQPRSLVDLIASCTTTGSCTFSTFWNFPSRELSHFISDKVADKSGFKVHRADAFPPRHNPICCVTNKSDHPRQIKGAAALLRRNSCEKRRRLNEQRPKDDLELSANTKRKRYNGGEVPTRPNSDGGPQGTAPRRSY
jgi:hypothetical protein